MNHHNAFSNLVRLVLSSALVASSIGGAAACGAPVDGGDAPHTAASTSSPDEPQAPAADDPGAAPAVKAWMPEVTPPPAPSHHTGGGSTHGNTRE